MLGCQPTRGPSSSVTLSLSDVVDRRRRRPVRLWLIPNLHIAVTSMSAVRITKPISLITVVVVRGVGCILTVRYSYHFLVCRRLIQLSFSVDD